jgi:hypothetical protein
VLGAIPILNFFFGTPASSSATSELIVAEPSLLSSATFTLSEVAARLREAVEAALALSGVFFVSVSEVEIET